MNNGMSTVLDKNKMVRIIQFIVLTGIAYVAPFFHQQFLTGPVINATLFIATILLGTQAGIMVGLIPSIIALSIGTLPIPLAPMVPYIMISNAILVIVFSWLKKRYWTAIVIASILKFIFLFFTSSIVIGLLSKKELAQSVSLMMGWPQLITALVGGVLAYQFLRFNYKQRRFDDAINLS